MRKLKLFLGAKAANTPPRGISKASRVIFSVLTLLLLSVGNVWAGEYTHTFATTTQSISGDVCTVTVADGHPLSIIVEKNGSSNFASYGPFRLYNKNKMTISANSGYVITQVDINFSSAQNLTVATDAVDYSYASYSFVPKDGEGNAASCSTVSFTNGNSSQARITSVTITYQANGSTPTCATPTFNPEGGEFSSNKIDVEIACATSGATIYYTTNGNAPTTSSSVYSSAISLTETTTLKALAVADGYNNSEIATAVYTKVDPFDGLKLDFVLSANNLSLPTAKGSSVAGNYTYTIGTTDYTFYATDAQGTSDGGIYFGGSYTMIYASNALGLPAISGYKLVKVEASNSSGCSTTTAVSVREGQTSSDDIVSGGTAQTWGTQGSKYTYNLSGTEENTMYYLYVATKNCQLTGLSLYYEEAETPSLPKAAKPTFETGGDFVTSTSVTLATTTEGATIYYTTNGDVPTSGSTLYEGAIPVSTTTTIKAIAVADGYDNSPVAEKTFTKVEALESLAALLEATTSSETAFNVVIDNWVVTGVNGTRAWISDAANEKGILLYKSGHGFTAGNKLNGVVLGTKTKLYQGYPELTTLVSTDVTVTTAAAITPRTTTIAALTSGYNAEQGTVVKLENLTYSSSVLTDGESSIGTDNKLFSSLALVDGTTYDIIGVVEYDNGGVIKIMPRSIDDVVAKSAVSIPTAANLAALKAAARGTYILTLTNAVVTYVNGNNAFIEDATGGALIYFASHGYSAGDCLNGDYQVVTTDYQGKFEITAVEPQAGAATTTAEIPLTTLTITQLNANFGSYESRRVKIVGANVTDAISGSDRNGAINDGAAVAVYAAAGENKITLTADDNVDIIGYPGYHNTDQQLNVWAQADITVNEKDPAGIAFDPESATHTPGIDDWSAPTFSNPNNLDVDFGTNNDAVATVSNTGVVTLAGGYGTAIITAHTDGDATHSAGNATYTITVNDPSLAPQNVVILAVYDTKYYAMSTTNANNGFTAIAVEYDGTQVTVKNAGEKAAIQWAKQTSGDNTTFQNAAGKYMKSADGASMSLQDAVCNWVWDATGEYYKIDGTSRTFFFQNTSGGIFKNYATSNIKKSGYSDKAQVIAIAAENIVITSKVSAELAYDPASDEITQGDDWSAPTLDNPHNVTITSYASDNEAVATVDGGVIALAGGIGTAHITAHFDGDGSYLEGDAVYTITVNAVPEPADVCDGTDDFLDTEDKSSPTSYKDRSTPNGWTAVNAGYKVIDEKAYWKINGKKTAYGVITSPELSNGIASLKFRYANTDSESNGVSVKIEIKQSGEVVKEYTLTKENSKVTQNEVYTEIIENINVAGTFQIVFTNLCPSNNTGNKDRVSIGRLCWSNYDGSEPQYTEVRSGLVSGRHYTVCLEKKVVAVKGATFWSVTYKNSENTAAYLIEENAPFTAGQPYIIQATDDNEGKLEVAYEGTSVNAPIENGALRGTFEYMDASALDAAGSNIYMLFNNELRPIGNNNHLDAHRAYVLYDYLEPINAAPAAPGRRVKSMPMQPNTATDIDILNASEVPVKVLIDGQIFILRGEKMYDTTGRLVK